MPTPGLLSWSRSWAFAAMARTNSSRPTASVVGSEQSGHRPTVIISGNGDLARVPNVLVVLPMTTRDRGLLNHVRPGGDPGLDAFPLVDELAERPGARWARVGAALGTHTLARADASAVGSVRDQ